MKWYIIRTKPLWEKQVATILARKKIIHFYPGNRVVNVLSKKKQIFEEPLLPCYLFVKITELQHIELSQVKGFLNFVFWLKAPVVIRDREVKTMQQFLSDHTNVSIKKITPGFNEGITNLNNTMEQPASIKSKAGILLSSLGYIMTGEIEQIKPRLLRQI